MAEHARLAAALTEPLCKLQSEAWTMVARLFSGRGGGEEREKGSEAGPVWKMQRLLLINIQCAFSPERVDKRLPAF